MTPQFKEEPAVRSNLKKFNNQDFGHLRALCLSQGWLFEDDTFPAHISSIGASLLPEDQLQQIEWRRPTVSYASQGVSQGVAVKGSWTFTASGSVP
uniref:Uncharacterized protein n=1 Tax=Anser brachyrhynchus TaxID=132585 RepID=A0A8B9I9M1_9AVES